MVKTSHKDYIVSGLVSRSLLKPAEQFKNKKEVQCLRSDKIFYDEVTHIILRHK